MYQKSDENVENHHDQHVHRYIRIQCNNRPCYSGYIANNYTHKEVGKSGIFLHMEKHKTQNTQTQTHKTTNFINFSPAVFPPRFPLVPHDHHRGTPSL